MIDAQQAAAGEHAADYATAKEGRAYWIAKCFDNLNKVREAHGLDPYVPGSSLTTN